jgi:hypothetical protein
MLNYCGKLVGKAVDCLVKLYGLRTVGLNRFLVRVRKSEGFTRLYKQFLRLLFHVGFSNSSSVSYRLIPTIPTPYKENNKLIYINFYTFIGAYS